MGCLEGFGMGWKTDTEWLEKAHQRLQEWGFETRIVTTHPDEVFEGWLREQPEYSRSFEAPANTSKGPWKRLTRGPHTVYGMRDNYARDPRDFLARFYGRDVHMVRASHRYFHPTQGKPPGSYFWFDVHRNQVSANSPYHRIADLREWTAERIGSFVLAAHPGSYDPAKHEDFENQTVYAVYCIGDDARFEFKMRWDV